MSKKIVILGVFVADTAYRADRMPRMGETIMGNSFALGPGGKGSNQAVAAAMAGGEAHFITKLGQDPFADMALDIWQKAGVTPQISQHGDSYTGAAHIFIEEASGDNAIIICPGIAGTITAEYVADRADLIGSAAIFMTQFEQPLDAALRALEIARKGGAVTILNPAPAQNVPDGMLALCDYVTPNESEAEAITGLPVASTADAREAAKKLLSQGAGAAVITLGENGALFHDQTQTLHVPAFNAGPVVETTGAGDAFNGAFATGLAQDMPAPDAVRYGCAAAAISVTRPGTAPSMPSQDEILALMAASPPPA